MAALKRSSGSMFSLALVPPLHWVGLQCVYFDILFSHSCRPSRVKFRMAKSVFRLTTLSLCALVLTLSNYLWWHLINDYHSCDDPFGGNVLLHMTALNVVDGV